MLDRSRHVVKLAPKWAPGLFRLGQILSLQRDPHGAVVQFHSALSADPENVDLQRALDIAIDDLPERTTFDRNTVVRGERQTETTQRSPRDEDNESGRNGTKRGGDFKRLAAALPSPSKYWMPYEPLSRPR